jgi:hypothetical protein
MTHTYGVQARPLCVSCDRLLTLCYSSDFYKWNPNVQTDCSGLWRDAFVCIGLLGPTTTISGGPPVPT